jgi:hypothetical protein
MSVPAYAPRTINFGTAVRCGGWLLPLTTFNCSCPFYTLEEPDPAGVSDSVMWLSRADPDTTGHVRTPARRVT